MTEFVRDRRHVMKRNPSFRGEPYPCEGEASDAQEGLLADCGKRMVTLVLAANLFADGVRDAFDPRARSFRPRLRRAAIS